LEIEKWHVKDKVITHGWMSLWENEIVVVKPRALNPVGMRVKAPKKRWENVLIRLLEPWIKEVGVNPVLPVNERYIWAQEVRQPKSVPVILPLLPSIND
jgi:hypothetical protein